MQPCWLPRTIAKQGGRSRNKVAVGEPAAGSPPLTVTGTLEGKRRLRAYHRAAPETLLGSEECKSATLRIAGCMMKRYAEEASEIDANRTWVPKGLGMIRRLTNGSAWALKKDVASCDKLRVGARGLRSGDVRMGLPSPGDTRGTPIWEEKPSERKHPSRRRKRNQSRFPELAASEMGTVQTEP